MKHRLLTLTSLFTFLALAACSGGPNADASGAGGDTSSTASGQSSSHASSSSSGGGGGIPVGMPISAPMEQWTWVPFDDAFCANGTPTGIGVNLTDKSKRVLIYLQGGGACWSEFTCYTLKIAANFSTGYGPLEFMGDEKTLGSTFFFDRAQAGNPFKDYSFV